MGVTLLGRFLGAEGRHARFAEDLAESVAWGDQRNAQFMDRIRKLVVRRGLAPVEIPEPEPFRCEASERLELSRLGAVIFTGGFRPDYDSWVHCSGAFDDLGFPVQQDGASSVLPGLYFVGVHFLRKRKSSLLIGVGEDATVVAEEIAAARLSAG
jgi:putative flavoprotein involved in K+ transport